MGIKKILSKTEEYLHTPSVIRYEYPFLVQLLDDFNDNNHEVEFFGRSMVVSKMDSKNPKIITCHIDRHGIVVNEEGKNEYASFNAKKHYGAENVSSETIFKKSGERFLEELVYAYDPLTGGKIAEGQVKDFSYDFDKKDLFFEIEGLEGLSSDTPIAYKSDLEMKDGRISSQIDNAISAAVIYQLVKDGFDGSIIFSTEEEIGRSWQHVTKYLEDAGIESQELINIDTTPYTDERAIQEGLVVLRNKDENGIFNQELVSSLKESCDKNNIKYEFKDEVIEAQNVQLSEGEEPKKLGKTELGRIIQYTDSGFNGATVQLPSTKYHTNHETTSELAVQNFYQALKKIL